MILSRSFLLVMRNVANKSCRENQTTKYYMGNKVFFRKSYLLSDNVEEYGKAGQATDDKRIWLLRLACWNTKATDTHSEYIILIAFPLRQWLHERSSILCCTYIACLVLRQSLYAIAVRNLGILLQISQVLPLSLRGGADRSLARPGRKKATATILSMKLNTLLSPLI
jgi:hypothetical protein